MPPFDQLRLTTARLILRPFQSSDAEPLFAILSEPKVMRYWSHAPWASVAQAQELIAKDQQALPAGGHIRLGMEIQGAGELIGMCTLFNLSAQCRRAEIGYGMSSLFWGQGYMHEALTALLEF